MDKADIIKRFEKEIPDLMLMFDWSMFVVAMKP